MKTDDMIKGISKTSRDTYTLVYVPRPNTDLVTIVGSFEAGRLYNKKNEREVADVMVSMFEEGTKHTSKETIQEKLDLMGANVSFSLDSHRIRFSVQCLSEFIEPTLSLVYEMLTEPRFDASQFRKVKKRLIAQTDIASDDTQEQTLNIVRSSMFPKSHPLHEMPFETQKKDIESVTLSQLKTFHRLVVGANNLILVAVGGSQKFILVKCVDSVFSTWQKKILPKISIVDPKPSREKKIFKSVKDKATVDVMIAAQSTLRSVDTEVLPFMMALELFGGRGLTSRLMSTVREKEGLTYSTYATLAYTQYDFGGFWYMYGTFAPQLVMKGIASLRRQYTLFVEKGISSKEYRALQAKYIGRYLISLSTTAGLAARILADMEQGLPATYVNDRAHLIHRVSRKDINDSVIANMGDVPLITVACGSITSTGKPL